MTKLISEFYSIKALKLVKIVALYANSHLEFQFLH